MLFRTKDTVMILSGTVKSAGIGLDFSRATFVIHLTQCWIPATIDQGSDHAIRFGQKDNVVLWHLYTNISMDEKIWASRQAKMARAHTLLDPKDIEHWSEEDYVKQVFGWRFLCSACIVN
jgi:SNF2 family DNA or RNA helicase